MDESDREFTGLTKIDIDVPSIQDCAGICDELRGFESDFKGLVYTDAESSRICECIFDSNEGLLETLAEQSATTLFSRRWVFEEREGTGEVRAPSDPSDDGSVCYRTILQPPAPTTAPPTKTQDEPASPTVSPAPTIAYNWVWTGAVCIDAEREFVPGAPATKEECCKQRPDQPNCLASSAPSLVGNHTIASAILALAIVQYLFR